MEISYRTKDIYNVLEINMGPSKNIEKDGMLYRLKMLQANDIPGLLKMDYAVVNELICVHYNVSSRYILNRMFKVKKPDGIILQQIMKSLYKTVEMQKKYLLDPNDIVFVPEYMFYDSADENIVMINVPGYNKNLRLQMKSFIEDIMKIYNHNDRSGLEYMYNLYELVCSEKFEMSIFQKYVNSYKKSDEKTKLNVSESTKQINDIKEISVTREIIPLSNGELESIEIGGQKSQIIVGREASETDYHIASQQISRIHACIYLKENQIYIQDKNSTNGTFVNAVKLKALSEVKLNPGDVIAFANEEFYVA